jgi:hypothetical protein
MGHCEVIKAKVVAFDEIFHLTSDKTTVNPGFNLRNATVNTETAQIKICVLECDNFRCVNGKVTGTITFAICEDFTITTANGDIKPVEFFFRLTRDFTFQKSNCTDGSPIDLGTNCTNPLVDLSSLQCQIERVNGTNTVTINDKDTFTQQVEIEVKIIAEIEKLMCVGLCQDTGSVNLVTPAPTTTSAPGIV